MNAEGEFPIPELRVVNQLRHQLTYAGCEDDVLRAESYWTAGYPGNIQEEVKSMRRKQQLHKGDRSDVVLQVLDDVKRQLTYPGRKHDVSFAEDSWAAGYPAGVCKDIEEMRRRQQLHKGDRSDMVLQELDDVKRQLTYPGWKDDVSLAEASWVGGYPAGVLKDIEEMRRRQQLHKGDRSDVVLQVLDDVKRQLTYPGRKDDVSSAEASWVGGYPAGVREDIEEMRRKQQLHDLKRKRSATTLANQPKHTNVAWVLTVYLVMALPILSCLEGL
jgi:uncharacterized protein YjlB